MKKQTKKKLSKAKKKKIFSTIFVVLLVAAYVYFSKAAEEEAAQQQSSDGGYVASAGFSLSDIPEYSGKTYVEVNGNKPFFTAEDMKKAEDETYFEEYGRFDYLGRCTAAFDCLGRETMPKSGEKREDISEIHPSGWHQRKYDCVYDNTLMTRSHLVGWMLSAENANANNLISGTRYMNSDGMLEWEKKTQNFLYKYSPMHVLYRVTPVFSGNELVARGVLMEAKSVEDNGLLLQFCVYVYNVQPGIKLNYSNGYSDYTGIFFDLGASSVVSDNLELDAYKMDMSTHTCHEVTCDKCGDAIVFAGDTSMVSSWPSLGYSLCSCLRS